MGSSAVKGRRGQATAKVGVRRAGKPGVVSRKLAVSFEKKLAEMVQTAAESRTGGNVSAWLAEAAQAHLRHEAGTDVLRALEDRNGPVSREQLETLKREWLG